MRWAELLRTHIAERYPDGELPTVVGRDEEEEVELAGLGLWLEKRGEGAGLLTGSKKRFFTLVWGEQSQTLKLCYYAKLQHGLPVNRKVGPCTLCLILHLGLSCVKRT